MATNRADAMLDALLEDLAAVEHERWAHWQDNVHRLSTRQPDGSLVVPADLVERWDRQIATPYAELTESEKEADREQVRRYWRVVERGLPDEIR